jgi:outer membrane protein OmpA-like peptidoglycan-associated protein
MRFNGAILLAVLTAALPGLLRAEPGDVGNSGDYPGFARPPGFVITDYTEDNPAVDDFSIARPEPLDTAHLETIRVTGHRYVIRYAPSGNQPVSMIVTQRYYEKLAAAAGFSIEKTGATGDVNETYLLRKPGRSIWVCLEPGPTAFVLTVMESGQTPPPPVAIAPPAPAPAVQQAPPAPPVPPTPPIASVSPSPAGSEDPLYAALVRQGHTVLPISFLPASADIGAEAKPLIDRIIAMMKRHPELLLTIEGHTDSTGDPDFNKTLSLQRARAVRTMIVAGGVPRARVLATGLGGSAPVADDATRAGRELNRRIELVLRKP